MKIKRKYLIGIGFLLLCCISIGYASLKTHINNTLNATVKPIPMIMEYDANHEFFSPTFRKKVKNIYFADQIDVPYNRIKEWDISANKDESVIAYYVANAEDNTMYDLYIEGEGSLYANYNSNHAFSDFSKVISINSLEKLSTSLTTNMSYMFANLSSLTTMDASSLDTKNVTDASYLFYACMNLTTIGDTSSWTLPKVTTMAYAFYYCPQLISLNTTNWDLSENRDMSWIFYSDTALTSLGDESKWNLRKVTTMYRAFYQCEFEKLNGANWGLDNLENMDQAFFTMPNLVTIENSGNWNLSNLKTMNNAFFYCSNLTHLDTTNWGLNSLVDFSEAFRKDTALISLGDTSKWNLSNVENMQQTFMSCESLKSLDTSNWGLESVTNMQQTFYSNSALTSLGDTNNWPLENVTTMNGTFNGCNNLTSLGIANWNTAKVTDFNSAFSNMNSLNDMDISKLNFASATDVNNMFSSCNALSGTLNINALNLTSANMFSFTTHQEGIQVTLNYTANNEELVDNMISSKPATANLVKGNLIS